MNTQVNYLSHIIIDKFQAFVEFYYYIYQVLYPQIIFALKIFRSPKKIVKSDIKHYNIIVLLILILNYFLCFGNTKMCN